MSMHAAIAYPDAEVAEKVPERIKPYGGDPIQTSLNQETEDRVRSALGEAVTT